MMNRGILNPTQYRTHQSRGDDSGFYTDANWNEYQYLVSQTGSVQFVDTGKRFRFQASAYMGNRTAVDFEPESNRMRVINIDTFEYTTITLSVTMPRVFRVRYFGDNAILTPRGIIDLQGNIVYSFTENFDGVTPGLGGVIRAHKGYTIYKGTISGETINFVNLGASGGTDGSESSDIIYGRLGLYLVNAGYGEMSHGRGEGTYVNPQTNELSVFGISPNLDQRGREGCCMTDGKFYRHLFRNYGWGMMQKVGTEFEGIVGEVYRTGWSSYGGRFGKFLGNIVSGGMDSLGTGIGYGSNNYFIDAEGNITLVQYNAFAYDTSVFPTYGFIDENGWIYPDTSHFGGDGVILKTDKTFSNLNRKNPYLRR